MESYMSLRFDKYIVYWGTNKTKKTRETNHTRQSIQRTLINMQYILINENTA